MSGVRSLPRWVGFGLLLAASTAQANNISGDLFYTVYSGTNRVGEVHYVHTGSTLTLTSDHWLTGATYPSPLGGSDGLVFDPYDGRLLVGGQNSNRVYKINEVTGALVAQAVANGQDYHLNINPLDLTHVWVSGIPSGNTQRLPIGATFGTAGTTYNVVGSENVITGMIFTPSGQLFYTNGDAGGVTGSFGTATIAGTTITTTRTLGPIRGFHGGMFDPVSGMVFTWGSDTINEINPGSPGIVASSLVVAGRQFDQGSVAQGEHMFLADNNGNLVFVDYSGTGLVGSPSYVYNQPFHEFLDDFAPLVGAGSQDTPEPTTLTLLGLGFLGLVRKRMRR